MTHDIPFFLSLSLFLSLALARSHSLRPPSPRPPPHSFEDTFERTRGYGRSASARVRGEKLFFPPTNFFHRILIVFEAHRLFFLIIVSLTKQNRMIKKDRNEI